MVDMRTGPAEDQLPPAPDDTAARESWAARWRAHTDVRLDRLRSAIDLYEREQTGLRNRPPAVVADPDTPEGRERASLWWRPVADELLELARGNAAQHRVDAAWEALHASQALSMYDLDDDELAVRHGTLWTEVEAELTGWSREAALHALSARGLWPPRSLLTAQELLNRHDSHVRHGLRVAGRRIATAAALLVATVLALWLATGLGAFAGVPVNGPFVLHDGGLFAGVLLLGAFGALLSMALDHARPGGSRRLVDGAVSQLAVPAARLALGAGAGVLAVAVAQAAVVGGGQPWMYLLAVPAGFSERLVRRWVEALEVATTTTDGPVRNGS